MGTLKTMDLVKEELAKCTRCGFCLVVCPIYQTTGLETQSPRGRNFLARSILSGDSKWSEELRDSFFQCLGCRACTEACFPALETEKMMVVMRSAYYDQHGKPGALQELLQRLLPDPKELAAAFKKASSAKPDADLNRSLVFLPWWNQELPGDSDSRFSRPNKTLRQEWPDLACKTKGRGKRVAYFGGCAFNFVLPEIASATLRLLTHMGYQVSWPQNVCCGHPAYIHGDLDAAGRLARKNLEIFQDLKVEAVVTECAHCSSFLKKYPELLGGETQIAAEARNFSKQVRDISEFLQPLTLSFPPVEVASTVTFHDPCNLSRFQKIKNQPRELLRRLKGLDLVEMPEADGCCGGGRGLDSYSHDLSGKVLRRKMENVRKTQAQILVTSCPGCYLRLKQGAKKNKVAVEVRYLTEILAGPRQS